MKEMKYVNLCRTKSQKGNIESVSAILNILREYSESEPDMTLCRILEDLGLETEKMVMETSQETLKRMRGK